jgi:hypothetical protein
MTVAPHPESCLTRRGHKIAVVTVLLLEQRYHNHQRFDKVRPLGTVGTNAPFAT